MWFAFHPFFNFVAFILFYIFFRKHSPFSLKAALKSKLSIKKLKNKAPQEDKELIQDDQIRVFIKNSIFSTITNIESSGIYGNLLIYFAALYLSVFNPDFQALAVSLLTILMIYGAVKTVILYYSGPLNIECAEACALENHDIIEDSINNSTRISCMLALAFLAGMIPLSGDLLLLLHENFFITGGTFDHELFFLAQVLFIMILIGQFVFGFATLFGNALIGTDHAKTAGIGFTITLIIIIIASPIFIFLFEILGVGIVMLIASSFLLPYMLIQIKRKLKIKFHFRLIRMLPNLIIVFIIVVLFPIGGVSGFIIKIVLIAVVYMALNPFLGVSIPEDIKVINDLLTAIKLKPFAIIWVGLMKFLYNISPFNKDKIELKVI